MWHVIPPPGETRSEIDNRVRATVERADAAVSLGLQQAFFADIASRYPGWEPASSQSVKPSDLAPPIGIWLVAYRDGHQSAAAACSGSTPRPGRSGGSSSIRPSAVVEQDADCSSSSRSTLDATVTNESD